MEGNKKTQLIVTESSLQSYFFDQLKEVNNCSNVPIREEILYYSSSVLNKFSSSAKYFDTEDGKVREKILGTKLLKVPTLTSREEQKRELKDIGDTALYLCGFFSNSLNKKLVDKSYYLGLGRTAYKQLNYMVPELMDIPQFYKTVSGCFELVTNMIERISDPDSYYEKALSSNDEVELLKSGIYISKNSSTN